MKKKIILQLVVFLTVFQIIGFICYYFIDLNLFLPLFFSSLFVFFVSNYKDLKNINK